MMMLLWKIVAIAVTIAVVICCCCWHWCHFGRSSSCSSIICSQFSWRSTWRWWWWCSINRWIITIVNNDDIIIIFGLYYPTAFFMFAWWSPIWWWWRWRRIIRSFPWWWSSFSCRWHRWWWWSCSSCRRGGQWRPRWRTSSATFRGWRCLFCAWLHPFVLLCHKWIHKIHKLCMKKCVLDVPNLFYKASVRMPRTSVFLVTADSQDNNDTTIGSNIGGSMKRGLAMQS